MLPIATDRAQQRRARILVIAGEELVFRVRQRSGDIFVGWAVACQAGFQRSLRILQRAAGYDNFLRLCALCKRRWRRASRSKSSRDSTWRRRRGGRAGAGAAAAEAVAVAVVVEDQVVILVATVVMVL